MPTRPRPNPRRFHITPYAAPRVTEATREGAATVYLAATGLASERTPAQARADAAAHARVAARDAAIERDAAVRAPRYAAAAAQVADEAWSRWERARREGLDGLDNDPAREIALARILGRTMRDLLALVFLGDVVREHLYVVGARAGYGRKQDLRTLQRDDEARAAALEQWIAADAEARAHAATGQSPTLARAFGVADPGKQRDARNASDLLAQSLAELVTLARGPGVDSERFSRVVRMATQGCDDLLLAHGAPPALRQAVRFSIAGTPVEKFRAGARAAARHARDVARGPAPFNPRAAAAEERRLARNAPARARMLAAARGAWAAQAPRLRRGRAAAPARPNPTRRPLRDTDPGALVAVVEPVLATPFPGQIPGPWFRAPHLAGARAGLVETGRGWQGRAPPAPTAPGWWLFLSPPREYAPGADRTRPAGAADVVLTRALFAHQAQEVATPEGPRLATPAWHVLPGRTPEAIGGFQAHGWFDPRTGRYFFGGRTPPPPAALALFEQHLLPSAVAALREYAQRWPRLP